MIGFIASILGKVNALRAAYTDARAGYLDRLDASITTRAAASTAVSNADLTATRIAKLDNLDALISSRLSTVINSIQYGYYPRSISAGGTYTGTVTITAVNTAKSVLIPLGVTGLTGGSGSNGCDAMGCTLNSSTQVGVTIYVSSDHQWNADVRGNFVVVEFK